MTIKTISPKFPDFGWAWPSGDLHQLLLAITLDDEAKAFAAIENWLNHNDINKVGFREHRLMAAIAARFGKKLAYHPAYARIAGLQRMLWTRSRFALNEATPLIHTLVSAGCPVMLLKGAARIAIQPDAQRSRISHDIDILVPPQSISNAVTLLTSYNWQAASGASPQRISVQSSTLRSMNFLRGDFGDIDLHQQAYHSDQYCPDDDLVLWQRAVPVIFADQNVFVPSAADRIAIAIAHGGLDAHVHSDWIIDCDAVIRNEDVDWHILESIISARNMQVPAAISLSYLHQQLGTPIPTAILENIIKSAKQVSFLSRLSALLQAKPKTDYRFGVALARGVAKQIRLARTRKQAALPAPNWRGRLSAQPTHSFISQGLDIEIPAPANIQAQNSVRLEIVIECNFPAIARRLELELNTQQQHLTRLTYRKLNKKAGPRTLIFKGEINVQTGPFLIQSRPSRSLRKQCSPAEIGRYAALPIKLISVRYL